VDETEVTDTWANEGRLYGLAMAADSAFIDIDVALSRLLCRVKDGEEDVLRFQVAVYNLLVV
jgi:hypothetical protein